LTTPLPIQLPFGKSGLPINCKVPLPLQIDWSGPAVSPVISETLIFKVSVVGQELLAFKT